MRLSGLVICQNNEDTIARCLGSLDFCDEIVVVDGGSTDNTVERCKAFSCRLIERPYQGTNDQKEFGRRQVKGDWIINIDSDESIGLDLKNDILKAIDHPGSHDGFTIPVRTRFDGRWIKGGGWWPNRQKRLFRSHCGAWDTGFEPHDRVRLNGSWGRLEHPIEHLPDSSMDRLAAKAERYGRMAARSFIARGDAYRPGSRWTHPVWRWIKSYVLKGGFTEGRTGRQWANLQFMEARVKYEYVFQALNTDNAASPAADSKNRVHPI